MIQCEKELTSHCVVMKAKVKEHSVKEVSRSWKGKEIALPWSLQKGMKSYQHLDLSSVRLMFF